jgi:hypothetical protein
VKVFWQNMQKGKRLSAWLIALFVSAQLVTTAHAATYSDQDHLHDGHPCIVTSIVKKTSDFDLSDGPSLQAPVASYGTLLPHTFQAPADIRVAGASARAPPSL